MVNVHAFADRLEAHLADAPIWRSLIADERAELLETGGGIKHAAGLCWGASRSMWPISIPSGSRATRPALETLKAAWDPAAMDILLLLVARGQGIGFEGPEGFLRDDAGRLTHSTDPQSPSPFANMGVAILKPQLFDDEPAGAFSIIPIWHRLQAEGRLHGVPMDGFWMHVGDPAARDEAEARLT